MAEPLPMPSDPVLIFAFADEEHARRHPVRKMVVTLKSGVQIKADVEAYAAEWSPAGGLRRLKWRLAGQSDTSLAYLDVREVAAIHEEDRGCRGR